MEEDIRYLRKPTHSMTRSTTVLIYIYVIADDSFQVRISVPHRHPKRCTKPRIDIAPVALRDRGRRRMGGTYVGGRTRERGCRPTAEYNPRPQTSAGRDVGEYREHPRCRAQRGNRDENHTARAERSERGEGCLDLMKITKVETHYYPCFTKVPIMLNDLIFMNSQPSTMVINEYNIVDNCKQSIASKVRCE